MEEEPISGSSNNGVHLQYLDEPTIYQYNMERDHDPIPPCEFEKEVQKSAIDIEEWDKKRKEEYDKTHTSTHQFLDNTHPIDIVLGESPLVTIWKQIEKARVEIQLVQKLLTDVRSKAGAEPDFRERYRFTHREETGDDLALSRLSHIANLEASHILYEDSTRRFTEGVTELRAAVTHQRNYFNDLYRYSEHFNILTFHGSSLSFIRNVDPLLLHCGFENSRDISCCLQIFEDDSGYIILKPHDGSYYSYLSITTAIIDESREYESTFYFHAKPIEQSPYNTIKQLFLSKSESTHVHHNLHCINNLHHSIICRAIFDSLLAGCTSIQQNKETSMKWELNVYDNELKIVIDNVFVVCVRIVHSVEALYDEDVFNELISSSKNTPIPLSKTTSFNSVTQSNLIYSILQSFNHSIILSLLNKQLSSYLYNRHHERILHYQQSLNIQHQIDFATYFCNSCDYYYRRLFIKYFIFVISQQFELLVYSNEELTNSKLHIKEKDYNDHTEIQFTFNMLNIPNIIDITRQSIFINAKQYTSLFKAFSGILGVFMQQIRLLYLNSCLHQHMSINRDLGDDLAVMNGNCVVTIISFDYSVPTPIAFYHAFVLYCNQGILINKEAGWISIGRKDRTKQPASLSEI